MVDMAGCGDAVFMYNLVQVAGVQSEYYVSTLIVISKTVKKEEWGSYMWSLGGVRTEIVKVGR